MEHSLQVWLEFILRFSHLVTGIAWIGSSFYFIWLDSSFLPPTIARKNVEGELFMVHGGFYYLVEKRKIFPGELPSTLHWFKWEATLTWFTGFLLLIALYYMKGASLLVDPSIQNLTQSQAVIASLLIIVFSWLIYDYLIWHPKKWMPHFLSLILSAVFAIGLIFLNFHIFSSRGAFIQTGAVFGSLMLLNVWIRILPGQKKMLAEAQAGNIPDYSVSLKSKVRSVHNTYFTFPVLFIMISNHYPYIYNHSLNMWLLIILAITGALVRHTMVTKNNMERWLLVPATIGLFFLIYLSQTPSNANSPAAATLEVENWSQVSAIFNQRCVSCHSQNPTDDIFTTAPLNFMLDTPIQAVQAADKIYKQVVETRVMPLGNKTQMTEEERQILAHWLKPHLREK